eukprot:Pompholyxophrys_punicea_v1_NODE_598_length_1615_cov_3.942308.p3 type:complete len:110 gc:universal NODE_598_length_1615_cov_3.942308:211-540(+)
MFPKLIPQDSYCYTRKISLKKNHNLYPPYTTVLSGKKKCYPDGIYVTHSSACVPLQALLNHTALGILEYNSEKLVTSTPEQLSLLQWTLNGGLMDLAHKKSTYKLYQQT